MNITFEQIPDILGQILEKMSILEAKIETIQDKYNSAPELPDNHDELLTFPEALIFLKITRNTLHRWKREGNIPFIKIGTRTYFKKDDLENYNRNQIKKPKGIRF